MFKAMLGFFFFLFFVPCDVMPRLLARCFSLAIYAYLGILRQVLGCLQC